MAKAKKPLVYAGADKPMAQHFVDFVFNEPFLYENRLPAFQKNLLRRLKSGTYDFDQSIRLWRQLADQVDKYMRGTRKRDRYTGEIYVDVSKVVGFEEDVPTRNLAAKRFAEVFRDSVNVKGPDYVAPYGELTWLALQEGIYKPPKKKAAKKKTAKKKAAKKKTAKKKATKKTNVVMLDEYQKRFG